MRRGYPNIVSGLLLTVVSGATMAVLGELPIAVTWAMVDVRLPLGLLFFAGIALAGYGVRQALGPPPKPQQVAQANAALIYGAMLSVAGTDGALHIDEVNMIQRCCQQFFQRNMSASDIRAAHARQVRASAVNFIPDITGELATPEARAWAYKAAIMVAKADGDLDEAEQARLSALAARIGLATADQAAARTEADALLASLKSAIA